MPEQRTLRKEEAPKRNFIHRREMVGKGELKTYKQSYSPNVKYYDEKGRLVKEEWYDVYASGREKHGLTRTVFKKKEINYSTGEQKEWRTRSLRKGREDVYLYYQEKGGKFKFRTEPDKPDPKPAPEPETVSFAQMQEDLTRSRMEESLFRKQLQLRGTQRAQGQQVKHEEAFEQRRLGVSDEVYGVVKREKAIRISGLLEKQAIAQKIKTFPYSKKGVSEQQQNINVIDDKIERLRYLYRAGPSFQIKSPYSKDVPTLEVRHSTAALKFDSLMNSALDNLKVKGSARDISKKLITGTATNIYKTSKLPPILTGSALEYVGTGLAKITKRSAQIEAATPGAAFITKQQGLRNLGLFVKGYGKGLKTQPFKASIALASGLVTGGVFRAAELGGVAALSAVSRVVPASIVTQTPRIARGLTVVGGAGSYAFKTGSEVILSGKPYEKLGEKFATEIVPFSIGTGIGGKAVDIGRELVGRAKLRAGSYFAEKIPAEELFSQRAIEGKGLPKTTKGTQEIIKQFEATRLGVRKVGPYKRIDLKESDKPLAKYIIKSQDLYAVETPVKGYTTQGSVFGVHGSPAKVEGKVTVAGKAAEGVEDPGLYVFAKREATGAFTRIDKQIDSSYSLNPFAQTDFGKYEPTISIIKGRDIGRYPLGVLRSPGWKAVSKYQQEVLAGTGQFVITKRATIGQGELNRQKFRVQKPEYDPKKDVLNFGKEGDWKREMGTSEPEAVVPLGSVLVPRTAGRSYLNKLKQKVFGFTKVTEWKGRPVIVRELYILSKSKTVKSPSKTSKVSDVIKSVLPRKRSSTISISKPLKSKTSVFISKPRYSKANSKIVSSRISKPISYSAVPSSKVASSVLKKVTSIKKSIPYKKPPSYTPSTPRKRKDDYTYTPPSTPRRSPPSRFYYPLEGVPPPPPPPRVPSGYKFKFGLEDDRKKKPIKLGRKLKYQPTLVARALGIKKKKKPKYLVGFAVRPIVGIQKNKV